jgi:TorA maturation chaperone TorD
MLSAIGLCSQILGALFLQNPLDDNAFELLEDLATATPFTDWPFGSEDRRNTAWRLLREGLDATGGTDPDNMDGTEANHEDTAPYGFTTVRYNLVRDYQRLFVGPHHFEAPAWGSVYLDKDQVLFGCSTLELRQWMRKNGITFNESKCEPEDHIGKMLMLLGWLAKEKPSLIPEYLSEHLMPWAPRYLELLAANAKNPYYRGLAILTDITLEDITKSMNVTLINRKLYY